MHFPGAWSQGPVTRKLVDNPTEDTGSELQLYPKKKIIQCKEKNRNFIRENFSLYIMGCEKVLDYLHIF